MTTVSGRIVTVGKSPSLGDVAKVAVLAAVYVIVARLGLRMDAVGGFATLVWLPTGISLAALLLFGYRLWPGVALGAFVANAWTGAPLPVALGIALGNTLEAVLGAYAVRRGTGFRRSLDRLPEVLGLIGLAGLVSTVVSATIGVLSLGAGGVIQWNRAGETWRAWWVGDMLGDFVVAPLLLTWGAREALRLDFRPHRLAEAAALGASVLGASWLIFFHPATAAPFSVFVRPYVLFPILVWAALRFELHGATTATFLVSALAVWGTALTLGPFVEGTLAASLLSLQTFMAATAVTMLVLGVVSFERAQGLRSREDLLAVVSHDLKSPLTAIQLSAGILLKRLPTDDSGERARKQVAIIQQSARAMNSLIRGLLDRAAIEAARLSLKLEAEDATRLVGDAVGMSQPLATKKSQRLLTEIADKSVTLKCDRERVHQVFSNLIGNAIKFTPDGGSITVRVERLANGKARFSVTDSGAGIERKDLPSVFQRFWRGERVSATGSGLGLSIAKGIVEAHGGEIWVESAPGNGTTFYFTLPALGA